MSFEDLPQEVLIHVFSYYVESEGLICLLTRIAKVSQAWQEAAMNYSLWTDIDEPKFLISELVTLSRKGQLSRTQKMNLSYVAGSLKEKDLNVLLGHSPNLEAINLSNFTFRGFILQDLLLQCSKLRSLTLRNVSFNANGIVSLIELRGKNMVYLDFSDNDSQNWRRITTCIAENCPDLEELHLGNVRGTSRSFPTSRFQNRCPKMRVLELGSFEYSSLDVTKAKGFPHLKSFLCGTTDHYGPTENNLLTILKNSVKLKLLDIRGCRLTAKCLLKLVATNLQSLYLSRSSVAGSSELVEVLSKWKHSLRDVDLSKIQNSVLIHEALHSFIEDNPRVSLEELDLSCTTVSTDDVKTLINMCPKLRYLNLESCRELPRGSKRIYRSRGEVESFLDRAVSEDDDDSLVYSYSLRSKSLES